MPTDPAAMIDAKIRALDDWRGPMLASLRALIRVAGHGVIEAMAANQPSLLRGGAGAA